jgi:cyclohexanecarboxylate-CoA ligase
VAFCRDAKLMTQKIPEQLELRGDMPRAATGKIVKTQLRDEYTAQPWSAPIGE